MKRDTEYFCGYRRAALTKLGDLFYDLLVLIVNQHDWGGGDINVT